VPPGDRRPGEEKITWAVPAEPLLKCRLPHKRARDSQYRWHPARLAQRQTAGRRSVRGRRFGPSPAPGGCSSPNQAAAREQGRGWDGLDVGEFDAEGLRASEGTGKRAVPERDGNPGQGPHSPVSARGVHRWRAGADLPMARDGKPRIPGA